jgi:hypothetical protein
MCGLECYQPSGSVDTVRIGARSIGTDRHRRCWPRARCQLVIGPKILKTFSKKSKFILHPPINTLSLVELISHPYQLISPLLTHNMSSSAPSGSSSSHDGRQDSTDWRLNRQIVPPWYKRPTCRCSHIAIVDVWKHDGIDRARR